MKGLAYQVLLTAQEMIVINGTVAVALRPDIGLWKYVTVDASSMKVQGIEAAGYLSYKDKLSEQGDSSAYTIKTLHKAPEHKA